MKCEQCGAEFQPSGRGKPQRFCSKRCRDRANYLRRRRNEPAPEYKPKPKAPVLNQREFDRMMDGSMEDELRYVRDRPKQCMG